MSRAPAAAGRSRASGRKGAGFLPDAAVQVAQTPLAGFKVQMKAVPGLCRVRGRSQGGSPPARCQTDPAESRAVPARKLSSLVIWETWRQRGRGGSLCPVPPFWLYSGLRRSRRASGGALQVAVAKSSRPCGGWDFSPLAVSVAFDFPSGWAPVILSSRLPPYPRRIVAGGGWGLSPAELEGQPSAFSFNASARGAGVRLGSVRG